MDKQYDQLSRKTILIIAGCHIKFVLKTLHECKFKIILIDTEEKPYAKGYIHSLLKYNYMKGSFTDDEFHTDSIIDLLGDRVKEISACFTYDDDYAHLAALICQKLGLIGMSPFTVRTVNSKKDTYEIISQSMQLTSNGKAVIPSICFRINSEVDILQAKDISYPAILKPEYGSFSDGVTVISSESDCIEQFMKLQKSFNLDWFGGKFGNSMVLMELLQGSVYQVDLIIFRDDLLKCIVGMMGPKFRDLGPPLPCGFSDTTTCYSSCLPLTIENELISTAFECCRIIGLNHGVYNVEMVLTDLGFRLLEINGRPGSYLRCSAFKVIHGIDLLIAKALISCGIRPILPKHQKLFAVGCYLYSFIHKESLSTKIIEDKIHTLCESNDILYIKHSEIMAEKEEACPKPFANLIALDEKSSKDAKIKLISICKQLNLSNKDYNIERMTAMFS